jgi:PTH2 family peptidyl-tRNA hydrolase
MSVKQVIVIRNDLNMSKGKMSAQAAHASMAFILRGSEFVNEKLTTKKLHNAEETHIWQTEGQTKICVSVDSEKELDDIHKKALEAGLTVNIIVDSGLTEFNGAKTKTCLAIGPNYSKQINKITGNLKLFK